MPVESIRQIKGDENVAVDRDLFRLVQTPQVFEANILKKAYEQEFNSLFTDDASVVEASGVKISLVEGNCENIKITTPFDLKLAEMMR
jgi:2-C-methyl-D-erythritol 4-phosphate cytidylyltransferase